MPGVFFVLATRLLARDGRFLFPVLSRAGILHAARLLDTIYIVFGAVGATKGELPPVPVDK
jgi:hypothetical protein